jgi:hypothetical protein
MHLCGGCRKSFPRTDEYFHLASRRKDGLCSWCKDCMRELARRQSDELKRRRTAQRDAFADLRACMAKAA